jgi:hypothetical protein
MGSTLALFLGDSGSNLSPAILTENFSGCLKTIPADARTQSEIRLTIHYTLIILCCAVYICTYLLLGCKASVVKEATLITDAHSSLSTAFCYHLLTFISDRSFSTSSNHLYLDLPILNLPSSLCS